MIQTEKEIKLLRKRLLEMWDLVISQLKDSKQAFLENDVEVAHRVKNNENRIDAMELGVDSECENYILLYAPKAVDMRLVLSIINVSASLERIADFANSICRYIIKGGRELLSDQLLTELEMSLMFDEVIEMLGICYRSFVEKDVSSAINLIKQDDDVDRIYNKSADIISTYLQNDVSIAKESLRLMVLLKKIERIGDHCNNIMEELVFWIDAEILKHRRIKKKDEG